MIIKYYKDLQFTSIHSKIAKCPLYSHIFTRHLDDPWFILTGSWLEELGRRASQLAAGGQELLEHLPDRDHRFGTWVSCAEIWNHSGNSLEYLERYRKVLYFWDFQQSATRKMMQLTDCPPASLSHTSGFGAPQPLGTMVWNCRTSRALRLAQAWFYLRMCSDWLPDFTRFVQQKSKCQSYQSSTRWPRFIGAKAQGISEGYCERFVQQRGKALFRILRTVSRNWMEFGWNLDCLDCLDCLDWLPTLWTSSSSSSSSTSCSST